MVDISNDDTVLRFALATFAMKQRALGSCAAHVSPPPRVPAGEIGSPTPSPNSPAAVQRMAPDVGPIQDSAEEWAEDDLLTALHGCLQYLQDVRDECGDGGDREEEAERIAQLLHEFVCQAQTRERLLRTLVDALVACEEGEEDSLLIGCVAQGEIEDNEKRSSSGYCSSQLTTPVVVTSLCYTSLTREGTGSDTTAPRICEEACNTLMQALTELQEEDFQGSAGGKVVAQTLDEIQSMLRTIFTESGPMLRAD